MTDPVHAGACLCGAIRYRIRGPHLQTTLCHCEDCRRASGAPAVAWSFFPIGSLEFTKGRPATIAHADRERTFCPRCGSPLTFFDPSIPHLFEVNTNSLDRPEDYPPSDQCWTHDRLGWFAALTELPGFERAAPLPECDES